MTELYELAVGELADLISNNIREHIENRSGNSEDFMNQVLDELQNLRQQEQLKAIRKVWGISFDLSPSSTKIRAKIINQLQKVIDGTKTIENGGNVSLVDENGNLIATSTTGQPKSLNFGNEIIEVFSTLSNKGHNKYTDLYGIKQNNLNIGLCIMDGEDLLVLNGEQLTLVLDSFLGKPLDSSKLKRIAKNNLEELNGFIKEKMIWLPDFTRLSFPGFDDLKKYPDFYGDNFTFDRLGIVGVS